MAISLIPVILGAGGNILSGVFSTFLAAVSEKVVVRLVVKLIDRLVKSSKNNLDDELWPDFRSALLKQIGDK